MSLMGFLTGAASLFGGGGSGTQQSMSSTQHSSASSEVAATAYESKTGKTTQTGSSKGTSATSGTSTNTGTTTGKEASQTTGQTTNYSSDVLASLDAILTQQLGAGGGVGSAQQATDALSGRLKQVQELASKPAFDVKGYAAGITSAATAATQNDLDSRINGILSATGSSEGGNSMSALLGAKLRNDAAANLAGISANATAQGEQIALQQETARTQQLSSLSGDLMANLSNLLGAAKGGAQTSTGTASTSSNQTQQQTGTQTGTTTENVDTSTTQTDESKTTQTGITQTEEKGTVSTKSKGSSGKSGDLFDKILEAFTKSATAA
jgi:hypothetical protein